MRLFTIISLFFLSSSCAVYAQDPIPKKYLDDFPEYYREYLNHDVDKKYLETYAVDNAFTKFNYTFYHKVYYDQPVLEAYIRSILYMLEPNKSAVDKMDVYITRSTEFNAFTLVDGSIFVNIGALAEMSSEAELAYLIAHEYCHYKLDHVKKGYLSQRSTGLNASYRKQRKTSEFSQNNELAADSMAFIMANSVGYDSRAMDILTQRLIFMQKQGQLIASSSYNEHDEMPTSHPVGEKRLDQIKLMKVVNPNGSLYPNGKERFENIKRLAEFEYLKLLDEHFDIHAMISFPLKKYLLTGDEVYLPTLVRGIRKAVLLNSNLKNQSFMTTHFLDKKSKFARNENILHHLYYEYPDSADVKLMLHKSVVDFENVPFRTFSQAFNYFSQKAIDAGYQEPLLDRTLFHGPKRSNGKTALQAYLQNPDNLYYEYASKLATNKVLKVLKDGEEIILLGGIHKYSVKKNWVYNDEIKAFKERHQVLTEMREIYQEKELKYKLYNYQDFIQSNPFGKHLYTIEQLLYGGYGQEIFNFDPRLYYAFKEANISSVEFLNMNRYDLRNRRLRFLLFVPPLTPYGLYQVIRNPLSFPRFVNVANYYRLQNDGEKWITQTNGVIKRFYMGKKRSEKVLYKLHRNRRRGHLVILGFFKIVYKE